MESLLAAPQEGNSPKHLRDTALLHLLYATGMRVTELVSLRLEDINLEAGELECPGKDGQRRILPFDEETRRILTEYLEHGRPYLAKNEHEHALFLNHRGKVARFIELAVERDGLDDVGQLPHFSSVSRVLTRGYRLGVG